MDATNNRLFDIPYNFDKTLIYLIDTIYFLNQNIYCFSLPPFHEDYSYIIKENFNNNKLFISKQEYYQHINLINTFIDNKYKNKLQLLLENIDKKDNMPKNVIQEYIKLGFTKFCVGNIEQGLIIKEVMPEAEVIGSITMHTTKEDIENNLDLYKELFTSLVLDFSYCKNINKIKELPKEFKYIMLINSLCNVNCKEVSTQSIDLLLQSYKNFETSCLIRPMDLQLFDPYIFVYKFQNQDQKIKHIVRDLVLYTTDWVYYPDIIYNEDLYQQE